MTPAVLTLLYSEIGSLIPSGTLKIIDNYNFKKKLIR